MGGNCTRCRFSGLTCRFSVEIRSDRSVLDASRVPLNPARTKFDYSREPHEFTWDLPAAGRAAGRSAACPARHSTHNYHGADKTMPGTVKRPRPDARRGLKRKPEFHELSTRRKVIHRLGGCLRAWLRTAQARSYGR